MIINGINVRDIRDAQDILMALETIKIGIENVSESMSENYTNLSSINKDISNSVSSQKGLIEGISILQIKSNDIIKNINILNNNTKSINNSTIDNLQIKSNDIIKNINILSNSTLDTIKKEFQDFNYQIKRSMSIVISKIDLSEFQNQVETLFNDKIASLESEARMLKNANDDLEKLNTAISLALRSSIAEFNRLSKVVNWKVISGTLGLGVFMGASLALGILFYQDRIIFDGLVIQTFQRNLLKSEKLDEDAKYTFLFEKE